MRDELEALLENEEELEAELAHVLAHRTFYYYKKKENPVEQTTGQENSVQEPEAEFLPQRERDALGWEKLHRERMPSEIAGISAVSGGAEALYLGLIRARQAAGYRRPDSAQRIPLSKEESAFRAAGTDAADLDRILQRDARRYDGGFTWQ